MAGIDATGFGGGGEERLFVVGGAGRRLFGGAKVSGGEVVVVDEAEGGGLSSPCSANRSRSLEIWGLTADADAAAAWGTSVQTAAQGTLIRERSQHFVVMGTETSKRARSLGRAVRVGYHLPHHHLERNPNKEEVLCR